MRSGSTLLGSFGNAFAGLRYVVRTQRNARIHLAVTAVALAVGALVGLSRLEWAVLVLVIGLVVAAEWFNTATEALVDLVTTERHPLAKAAKDVAAAGVLLTAVAAVVIGALLLGIPLWNRFADSVR